MRFLGGSISIIQLLVGHKDCRSERQELELEQFAIQRLLHTTTADNPERLNALRSEKSSIVPEFGQTAVCPESETSTIATEAPEVLPELSTSVIECSLSTGSWRCRCPNCLEADKAQIAPPCFVGSIRRPPIRSFAD